MDGEQATTIIAALEERLRVLHALRTEAQLVDDFETPYVAFVRALRERLHPRGVPDIRTVKLDDGLSLSVDVGDRLGCDVFYGYYQEAFDARIFTGSLPPSAIVVDIGANFGYYTLQSARALGPQGVVYAFEPDPNALSVLRRNINANNLDKRVLAWQIAVGDSDGTVALQLAAESAFTSIRPTGRSEIRGSVDVPLRSLDSFFGERGILMIDALKIDAEGLEGPILRGARGLLRASLDPIILLEISAKNLTDDLHDELSAELAGLLSDGFVALRPDVESAGGLQPIASAAEISDLTNTNIFLVRAGGSAELRLRDVSKVVLETASALLNVQPTDVDRRQVVVHEGLDPAVVTAALRDRADLRRQVTALLEQLAAYRHEELAPPGVEAESTVSDDGQAALIRRVRSAQDLAQQTIRRRSDEVAELRAQLAQQQREIRDLREQSESVVARQSAEVVELREALARATDTIERQQEELADARQHNTPLPSEKIKPWREMVHRLSAEVDRVRASVETLQAQLHEWRTLSERLGVESDDRRAWIDETQRDIDEKNALIETLWAKLAAARGDRDTLQSRCSEQMREIWRLRDESAVQAHDPGPSTVLRLG